MHGVLGKDFAVRLAKLVEGGSQTRCLAWVKRAIDCEKW